MAFMYGKWRAVEEAKVIRERYGENAALIKRDPLNELNKSKPKKKTTHSFQHLIGKRFKVPQYQFREFLPQKEVRTYRITDEEKARNKARFSK